MTEKLQIYKCDVCGNVVQVLISQGGELVCCSQPMILQQVQHDTDELGEKHAPQRETVEDRHFVNVKKHPMLNEHYIQFIEIIKKDKKEVLIKYFEPNEVPEYEFDNLNDSYEVQEYCNIHHLWGENND